MTDTNDSNWYMRLGPVNIQGGRELGFSKAVAKWGEDVGRFNNIACQETKLPADKSTKYLLFDKHEPSEYEGH